ncbi:MAG TPA: hypothetical protein PK840_07775 [Bacilli bacterium]|nr:hypothetical protein [Bacilli bacterium]
MKKSDVRMMTKDEAKKLIVRRLKFFGKPYKNSPSLRVTVEDLRRSLQSDSHKPSRSDVNELIRELRMNDELSPWTILSDNKGYYLSKDTEEVRKFVESLYHRSSSIQVLANEMRSSYLQKILRERMFPNG